MNVEQLEIGFGTQRPRRHHSAAQRRRQRKGRAQWWFERMRQAVNQALDWGPTPPARPEQIYLVLAKGR